MDKYPRAFDQHGHGIALNEYIKRLADKVQSSEVIQDNVFTEVVINYVFIFIVCSLNNSPMELVWKICLEYFSIDELVKTKNLFYDAGDKTILPKYKTRRGGSVTPESEAVINDIISGISKLGEQDKMPQFPVDVVSLSRFPKCIPAETNSLSMCEMIRKLEKRMKVTEETLSENVSKSIQIEDKVNNFASYSAIARSNSG